jgi:hypothetical protein
LLWLVLLGGAFAVLMIAFFAIGVGYRRRAVRTFGSVRARLQDEFLAAAGASGKPRGLRWKALDWFVAEKLPEPLFARSSETGEIVALVPVTIQFEAIEGSDMEGLPAVGNLRNASAVFFYRLGRWQTSGKAVFNLNPDEALVHFKDLFSSLEGD